MEEQEWCTSQRSSKAYVLKTCGLIYDGVIKSSKHASSFCPQHLLQMSFPAFINFSRFTSSACLSGRGLITGLSHSANFWSWTVFCLWSQSSAEKVGNSSPSTFYQNCSDSDWTEIKRKQTDLTGISGEISFLYYLLKGLIWVRTHVHVKRKDSH